MTLAVKVALNPNTTNRGVKISPILLVSDFSKGYRGKSLKIFLFKLQGLELLYLACSIMVLSLHAHGCRRKIDHFDLHFYSISCLYEMELRSLKLNCDNLLLLFHHHLALNFGIWYLSLF